MLPRTREAIDYLVSEFGGRFIPTEDRFKLDTFFKDHYSVSFFTVVRQAEKLGMATHRKFQGWDIYARGGEAPVPKVEAKPIPELSQADLDTFGGGYIEQATERKALTYAMANGKNVLLVGPAGSGKTTLVEEVIRAAGKKPVTVSCDVGLEAQDLIGYKTLVDGNVIWVDGVVSQAMRARDEDEKSEETPVFDEINFAEAEVFGILNAALDHRRTIVLKEKDGEILTAPKDFVVFATMNRGYAGTKPLNEAFKDRFALVIELTYLPADKEEKLLRARTGVDATIAKTLVKIANDTRSTLDAPISTRTLLEWGEAIAKGFSPAEAAEYVVLARMGDEGDREDARNIIRNYAEVR